MPWPRADRSHWGEDNTRFLMEHSMSGWSLLARLRHADRPQRYPVHSWRPEVNGRLSKRRFDPFRKSWPTVRDVRLESAFGGKAEIGFRDRQVPGLCSILLRVVGLFR